MVETTNAEEPTLPSKRKPDVGCKENEEEHPNKSQKLQSLNNHSQISEDKTQEPDKECVNSEVQVEKNDDVDDGDADDGDVDDDEDEDEDEGADGNGEVVVDRKGKGILIEDEEDDESDDDDSSDGQSDGDSDLSDDSLAEVDLGNILPGRTRRREIQPGEFIANDLGGGDDDDDDGSDSDEDDAA